MFMLLHVSVCLEYSLDGNHSFCLCISELLFFLYLLKLASILQSLVYMVKESIRTETPKNLVRKICMIISGRNGNNSGDPWLSQGGIFVMISPQCSTQNWCRLALETPGLYISGYGVCTDCDRIWWSRSWSRGSCRSPCTCHRSARRSRSTWLLEYTGS